MEKNPNVGTNEHQVPFPDVPPGRIECNWCGAFNIKKDDGQPLRCFKCKLVVKEKIAKGKKASPKTRTPGGKNRRQTPNRKGFQTTLTGAPVIGIDPGAKYTGVVIRDADVPLLSTTLVRPDNMTGPEWAVSVVEQVEEILEQNNAHGVPMGIEGISDPKGFYRGTKAAINPKDIIRAGMVVGALCATWKTAHIIDPGDNGSQHLSFYPDVLKGRRPKTLAGSSNGAKTRNHEQSAYDVAGKTQRKVQQETRKKNRKKINFS